MNEIERLILNRYEQKECGSYYDAVQKVKPNYTVYPKHNERVSRIVLTDEGPERRYGRKERFKMSLKERHLRGEL